MPEDFIAAINEQLFRLRARPQDVAENGIRVEAREDENAVLLGNIDRDYYWRGSTDEILERLKLLPVNGGPEVIRSEFT